MKIGINAGHSKIGVGRGAYGYLNESVETRKITCELMSILADTEYEVFYLGIDKHSNNLKYVVDEANKINVDLFVSIHLNAGGGSGCEVYTWNGEKYQLAKNICENITKLGFKNRGIKDGSKYYVIKNTKMRALLVECCFVDSNDYKLYDAKKIAQAIADAIRKEKT